MGWFKIYILACCLSHSCFCIAKVQILSDNKKSIFLLDSSDKKEIDLGTLEQLKDDYFISGEHSLLSEDEKKALLAIPVSLDYHIKKELLSYSKIVSSILFATSSCWIYFCNFREINAQSYGMQILNNFLFIGGSIALIGSGFKMLDFSSNQIGYKKFPLIFHVERKFQ